jgi:hypothetical protein
MAAKLRHIAQPRAKAPGVYQHSGNGLATTSTQRQKRLMPEHAKGF